MKLEHFGMAEPGDCRLVVSADAAELAAAAEAERAEGNASTDEADLLTAAVNRALLAGFEPIYAQLVAERQLVPIGDPDFELLAADREQGFRAGVQFYCLPALELGRYTGFVQRIQPRPIRRLTVELEINRAHGDEERAADAAGKQALRERVTEELYSKRCAQARVLAERALLNQLGAEVRGSLPKQLIAGNYFAEQRQFNLRLQANGVNFDQYLKVRGESVEQFRAALHAEAEQKLRSRLGLLLVADKEALWPDDSEVEAALSAWDAKRDGERTFPSNDARKVRQRLASERAAAFVLAHSSLLPPSEQPVMAD